MTPALSSAAPSKGDTASESSDSALFASDQFRMYAYKILPCAKRTSHEWTTCPFAHPGEKARRRDPRLYNYLAIPCEATKNGATCPRGDDCPNCHSLFEFWLHPSRYRTQLCRDNDGSHCKRQVCFFAHSIEELRVPDHSHLNIPASMMRQASGSATSSSQASTDTSAAASSDTTSSASSPRAGNKDTAAQDQTKSPTGTTRSQLVNISDQSSGSRKHGRRGKANHSPSPPLHGSPVIFGAEASPSTQRGGFAGMPVYGSGSGTPSDVYSLAASLGQQQCAALSLQQCQLQSPSALSPAGSMYEQQVQMLLAAEAAQAQAQVQQQLMMQQLQQNQHAAAWSAHMAQNAMRGYADASGVQGGSPPLSPMPSSLMDAPGLYRSDSRVFVPPSASSSTLSAMAAAAAGWQPASLLRTLSVPASAGLVRHASGGVLPVGSTHFASSGGSAQLQHSAGSSVSDVQDVTLASLLGCNPGNNWAPGASAGMVTGAEAPTSLGYGQGAQESMGQGLGGFISSSGGLDATSLLLLQQQQQKGAMADAANLLQSLNTAQLGDCNGQAMNDVIGMMMQQLLLQQPSVAV